VFDSGTGLDHDEFAGKDHRSIHLADVLADGSLCAREVLSGPDACFASDGDQVAVSTSCSTRTMPICWSAMASTKA
jgi:subtilase-type serine protease